MFQDRFQTFERLLLNDTPFDLAERSFEPVCARTILGNEICALTRARNSHERSQRERSVEVVAGINLFRRDQDLWSNLAIAFVNRDVVNGDNRFQSKLDLGPHDRVFDHLQAGF